MSLDPITAALDIGGKLIERIWPNPEDQAAARLKLLELQRSGELDQLTLAVRDRDSARSREVGVKDHTNKILAFVIIGAFVCLVASTCWDTPR